MRELFSARFDSIETRRAHRSIFPFPKCAGPNAFAAPEAATPEKPAVFRLTPRLLADAIRG